MVTTRFVFQANEVRHDIFFLQYQKSNPAWERKPFWTRRARIKQQRLSEPFNFLPMRMTKDAEVWLFFLEERSSIIHQLPAFI